MKYMIASDIHGSAHYCRQMLKAFDREEADKLILLGDILYHGPRNDLPEEYAPKSVIKMLNDIKDKILSVRGNCDGDVDQMVLDFPIMASYAILCVAQRVVYITHGHVYNLKSLPPLSSNDIILHGHTHVPAWEKFGDNNYYLNPGSVSIPKEGSERGYMIIEDELITWKSLDGRPYHEMSI